MVSPIEPDDFLARLREAQRMLAAARVSTPGGRQTARLLARLEARLSRPISVAVLGEPNSGKTTLINRVLGRNLLATDAVQNTRSVVRVRHASTPSVELVARDGTRHRVGSEMAAGRALNLEDTFEIGVPIARLATMTFFDTPGWIGDDVLRGPHGARPPADIDVWCTIATQAWRASEVAAWQSLCRPAGASVLAVTRSDLLSAADRDKVRGRLVHEAGGLFRSVIMVEGGPAAAGEAIAEVLDVAARDIRELRAHKAAAIMGRQALRLEGPRQGDAARPSVMSQPPRRAAGT